MNANEADSIDSEWLVNLFSPVSSTRVDGLS